MGNQRNFTNRIIVLVIVATTIHTASCAWSPRNIAARTLPLSEQAGAILTGDPLELRVALTPGMFENVVQAETAFSNKLGQWKTQLAPEFSSLNFEPCFAIPISGVKCPNVAACLAMAEIIAADTASALSVEQEMVMMPQSARVQSLLETGNGQWLATEPLTVTPMWTAGITGTGQIIGIADCGLDTDNACSVFQPNVQRNALLPSSTKVLSYMTFKGQWCGRSSSTLPCGDTADDVTSHGTHTTSIAVGSGTTSTRGIAPDTRIVFADIHITGETSMRPPINPGMGLMAIQSRQGAKIHLYAWACAGAIDLCNDYSQAEADSDKIMFILPPNLGVYAAGQHVAGSNEALPRVASPSTCKNGISVGATVQTTNGGANDVADFSPIGPTWVNGVAEGRFKPDLVAPGSNILSSGTFSNATHPAGTCGDRFISRSGTSVAAAAVSGLAVLVRQYFTDGFYPTGTAQESDQLPDVSGAMVKAVLIHSAQPVTGTHLGVGLGTDLSAIPTPNVYVGFGQPQLDTVLKFPASSVMHFSVHDIKAADGFNTTGSSHNYDFSDVSLASDFKATLVWTDYPGDALTAAGGSILVNDLDLVCIVVATTNTGLAPIGTRWQPNGLTTPMQLDTKNNVERVWTKAAPTAIAGTDKVNVTCTVTPTTIGDIGSMDGQGYALTATWE